MSTRMRWSVVVLGAALAFSAGPAVARGQLLFSDSFRYPGGPLAGKGPPVEAPPGQSGWRLQVGSPLVTGESLFFDRVFAKGSAVSLFAGTFDAAEASLAPVNSGVVWVGFTMNLARGDACFGYADLHLGSRGILPVAFGLIFDRGVLGIDNDDGGLGSQARTKFVPTTEPAWVVAKLDFEDGFQALFINPTMLAEPRHPDVQLKMRPDFQARGFNEVSLVCGSNNGEWGFDEVRIGLTYADVRTGP